MKRKPIKEREPTQLDEEALREVLTNEVISYRQGM